MPRLTSTALLAAACLLALIPAMSFLTTTRLAAAAARGAAGFVSTATRATVRSYIDASIGRADGLLVAVTRRLRSR